VQVKKFEEQCWQKLPSQEQQICWTVEPKVFFTSFSSSTIKLLDSLSFCSSTIKVTPLHRKLPLQTIHNSVLSVIYVYSDENPAGRPFVSKSFF
jgi:hypothetical protein